MTETPRKNPPATRGRPFAPGNPGRPAGARNRATLAVEALFEGEAVGLARRAVELAMGGDTVALRLCLDRIAPPRKGRTIALTLPPVTTASDVAAAVGAVVEAVAAGDLTPDEGRTMAAILETRRRAIETLELENRLSAIEHAMEKDR